MNDAQLYHIRIITQLLRQINKIEGEFHKEKIKHIRIIEKYHSVINFWDTCLFIVQFCVLLLNVGFLSNFHDLIGKTFTMISHGLVCD